jgi:hypothetical protein
MTEEPLIYTTKGNLPISSLQYRHEWQEDGAAITLIEEHLLDGEVVKRAVHVRLKQGLQAAIEGQLFNMSNNHG